MSVERQGRCQSDELIIPLLLNAWFDGDPEKDDGRSRVALGSVHGPVGVGEIVVLGHDRIMLLRFKLADRNLIVAAGKKPVLLVG